MEEKIPELRNIFIEILRWSDDNINELIRGLISGFNLSSLFILIGLSFLYGILHSIGPGHGKSLVASFFLKEKRPLRKSLVLSMIISIIHTGSAIILSFLLFFVLTGIKGMFRIKLQSYFMIASGILIIVAGTFFLIFKIFCKEKDGEDKNLDDKNLLLIGISAGIVPCPVALMIMFLTLSKKAFFIGLLSVSFISFGMFVLLSLIGIASSKLRDGILSVSSRFIKKGETVAVIIEYVSILLIIFIGISILSGILIK